MNQRPPKPAVLLEYESIVKAGPPKCCHTCDNYSHYGDCSQFNMRPPDDFAGTADACPSWTMDIPF